METKDYKCKNCLTKVFAEGVKTSYLGDCPICGCSTLEETNGYKELEEIHAKKCPYCNV